MATGGIVAAVSDPKNSAVVNAIRQVAQQLGVDPNLALAIAYHESGFNPTSVGDHGTSFGIYQLHQGGELDTAPRLTAQQAFDPTTNAQRALSVVANVRGFKTTPGEIAATAQRPANPAAYAIAVDRDYAALTGKAPAAGAPADSPYGESIFTGGPASPTGAADEGYLFQIHIPGTSTDLGPRWSTVRRISGGAVLVLGGAVSLAGVFILVGARNRLPNPVAGAQGVLQGRRESREADARLVMAGNKRNRDREEKTRQAGRDEVGERRRARQERAVSDTRTARAAGERDADAAGPF